MKELVFLWGNSLPSVPPISIQSTKHMFSGTLISGLPWQGMDKQRTRSSMPKGSVVARSLLRPAENGSRGWKGLLVVGSPWRGTQGSKRVGERCGWKGWEKNSSFKKSPAEGTTFSCEIFARNLPTAVSCKVTEGQWVPQIQAEGKYLTKKWQGSTHYFSLDFEICCLFTIIHGFLFYRQMMSALQLFFLVPALSLWAGLAP